MGKKILVMGGEAIRNHVKGPVTKHVLKRLEENPPPEDIRAIPVIESDKCILCGTCVKVCPTHCLTMEKENKDNGMIWILAPQCMFCAHCEIYCPKDCIHVSGQDPLEFAFEMRTDYRMLCEKGSFAGKVAEKKIEELKKEAEEEKKSLRGYA
ncbi:MAG: 4Fe-4S binding protein [Candidatus Heimdallarchaeum aukensis]|uniref:4Fe-4S binding protein n=1 Tax=Candidatus Heimdallarchaeum aukensis TaxID=2876573 RepID=A0A9Y1FKQ7_9ARCH|nr:MAG: 4Fe-4S binding protein [Candidatus Heimdallarchaeum aukensis]